MGRCLLSLSPRYTRAKPKSAIFSTPSVPISRLAGFKSCTESKRTRAHESGLSGRANCFARHANSVNNVVAVTVFQATQQHLQIGLGLGSSQASWQGLHDLRQVTRQVLKHHHQSAAMGSHLQQLHNVAMRAQLSQRLHLPHNRHRALVVLQVGNGSLKGIKSIRLGKRNKKPFWWAGD